MSELEELRQRMDALESALAAVLQGGTHNILTDGNISMLGDREPWNPLKFFMGKDPGRGLYFFFQERFPGQGTELWGGFETYLAPPDGDPAHASWGYGALPGRAWFLNFLLEANGDQVGRNIVVDRIYLQQPKHRNLLTGEFEKPHHYDGQGVPYDAAGEMMGGIQVDYDDLGVYLTHENGKLAIYENGVKSKIP